MTGKSTIGVGVGLEIKCERSGLIDYIQTLLYVFSLVFGKSGNFIEQVSKREKSAY